jgi:putative nucleotidyltransferase with HDIG domain
MITLKQARQLAEKELKGSHKLGHSLLAGKIMAGLAKTLRADAGLWESVGLLHDIDAVRINYDAEQHGTVAVQMLEGFLPAPALKAIAAHDSHTGVKDESDLSLCLRGADLLALVGEKVAEHRLAALILAGDSGFEMLKTELGENSGWALGLEKFGRRFGLTFQELLSLVL